MYTDKLEEVQMFWATKQYNLYFSAFTNSALYSPTDRSFLKVSW